MKRKVVEIDRDRCNGCGLCIPNCAEGALRIEDGKAVLVSDKFCDGLGACLGHCPQDAIRIVERETEEFDQAAVAGHASAPEAAVPHSCPGSQVRLHDQHGANQNLESAGSHLTHWPVQLHLVPVGAPFFKNADLLISATCVPFACGNFHDELLANRSLAIACPKLDRTDPYLEKLTEIFKGNDIGSVTVAVMEVPCCQGLAKLVRKALELSGKDIPLTVRTIAIRGGIMEV